MKHVLFSTRAAFGTWTAPDRAMEVISANVVGARERIDGRYTGAGHALRRRFPGAKTATGAMATAFWPQSIGYFLAAWMRDVAVSQPDDVGSPTVYDHGFFFDEELDLLANCLQEQWSSTFGLNVLSAIVNQLTIKCAKKQTAELSFDLAAKDAARCGETWDHDGSPSPAIIAASSLYPTAFVRPFIFYDAEIILGGTVSLDDTQNKIEVAGGTAYSQIENIEITIGVNLDTDAFGDTRDPTLQSLRPGNRDVAVTFDVDWRQASSTFYDAWLAGEQAALQLNLRGPAINASFYHEAHIVLPLIDYGEAPPPELGGEHSRLVQTVQAAGLFEDTAGTDVGIWLRTTDGDYTV